MITADLARVLMAAVLIVWHDQVPVVYLVAFGLSGSRLLQPDGQLAAAVAGS